MNKAKTYTVVSLFSGMGGLDLGFEYAGFRIVWANDFSRNAVLSYTTNFSISPTHADISKLSFEEIPESDVIIGGPPCQSFSLVGYRRPDDNRGRLVFRFLEIVKGKKPRAFVMENVAGMAASRIEGKRLPIVLAEEFERSGYTVNIIKLNAAKYLVPQLRKRIFIIGCLDGKVEIPNAEEFAHECYGLDINEYDISAAAAIGDLGSCVSRGEQASYRCEPHSPFSEMMRKSSQSSVSLHECPRMSGTDQLLVSHIPPGGNYLQIPDEIATARVLKFKATGGRTTTYGRLHPDRPSYTINTYFRRPNVGCNFHYSEPRLITPREAMRFQAIPDHFELVYGSQDERNAFIGNAVPPLLAHAIAWSLRQTLNKVPRQSHSEGILSGR